MDDGNDSLIAPRRLFLSFLSSGIIIGPSTKVNTHTSQVSFAATRKRKWILVCRRAMNGNQMRSFPGEKDLFGPNAARMTLPILIERSSSH